MEDGTHVVQDAETICEVEPGCVLVPCGDRVYVFHPEHPVRYVDVDGKQLVPVDFTQPNMT